jgi:hypothetical protein
MPIIQYTYMQEVEECGYEYVCRSLALGRWPRSGFLDFVYLTEFTAVRGYLLGKVWTPIVRVYKIEFNNEEDMADRLQSLKY